MGFAVLRRVRAPGCGLWGGGAKPKPPNTGAEIIRIGFWGGVFLCQFIGAQRDDSYISYPCRGFRVLGLWGCRVLGSGS